MTDIENQPDHRQDDETPGDGTVRGLRLDALTAYLQTQVPGGLAGPLRAQIVAGGRSNPTYEISDGISAWILRRPPLGDFPAGAHDVTREYRVLEALSTTDIPVPDVVCCEETTTVLGVAFYVMSRVEGRTFRTWDDTSHLTPEERAALSSSLIGTLTRLHEIDPASVGLARWGRPDGYLQRQLARWHRQWHAVKTSDRSEVDELMTRLERTMPASGQTGIVHGDYKIDNLMVDCDDPGRILAVLDWEMATLGDPLADLGMLVSFWDEPGGIYNPITAGATAHAGFPLADDLIGAYAELRSLELSEIDWYVIFSDVKVAVILEQIHARFLRNETVGSEFDDIGRMVGPLLDRARERAARSTIPGLRR